MSTNDASNIELDAMPNRTLSVDIDQVLAEYEGHKPTSPSVSDRLKRKAQKITAKRLLNSTLPVIEWLPQYNLRKLQGDVVAALTSGVLLVPQALAYAILASLPPQYGLYGACVPLLVYAVFGTSRQIALGPVAIVSLLFANALISLGITDPNDKVEVAMLITFFAGVIELGLGFISGGIIATFLSHSVLTGFTTGASVVIIFSQIPQLFGITVPKSIYPWYPIGYMFAHIYETKWVALTFGLISLFILQLFRWIKRRLPRKVSKERFSSERRYKAAAIGLYLLRLFVTFFPLIVVIVATVISAALFRMGLITSSNLVVVGEIPLGFPMPVAPNFAKYSQMLPQIFTSAIVIAIFAFVESFALSEIYARKFNYEIDANQELIALGMAKFTGSFFNAYAVTGSLSRTAINADAGAQTQMAGFLSGILMFMVVMFLGPVFYYLPKAVLAALVINAVIPLFDVRTIRETLACSRTDAIVTIITVIATVAFDIVIGLIAGVSLSIMVILKRIAFPHWAILGQIAIPNTDEKIYRNIRRYPQAQRIPCIRIMRLDTPLWFVNAKNVYSAVMKAVKNSENTDEELDSPGAESLNTSSDKLKAIVMDCSGMDGIDMSGIEMLQAIQADLKRKHISFVLCEVRGPVRDSLKKASDYLAKKHDSEPIAPWLHRIALNGEGPWHFMTRTVQEAVDALQAAWNRC